MKFLQFILLFSSFFILLSCKDLSFSDEDSLLTEKKPVQEISNKNKKPSSDSKDNEENLKEATILSEDLELFEDTIIQNKKVILDTARIQTNEYELKIIAEEFISNHSIIQNFLENQTTKKDKNGKSGGDILVEAKIASGSLKLILNGENAGAVLMRPISREDRQRFSGLNGRHGRDAVYREFCRTNTIFIYQESYCWEECIVNPTRGENGRDARQGFPGFNGKNCVNPLKVDR